MLYPFTSLRGTPGRAQQCLRFASKKKKRQESLREITARTETTTNENLGIFLALTCNPAGLLQNRGTGKPRKWLGRVLGRVLRKFGVLEGGPAEGAAAHSFPRNPPLAAPSPALPPAPRIFPALFPAPSPAIFWVSPFLYSVAGRPGRKF